MNHHLAESDDHMLAARSSDGIVYLDVVGDAYHCRYAPLSSAWPDADDPIHPVAGQPLPYLAPQITPASIMWFLRALARTALDFSRLDFAALLAAAERLPTPAEPGRPEDYARAVAAFEQLCLWVPFPFLCLFRSYVLLQYLAAQRLSASWVFGVSLFPFEAHCWLTWGDYLIGEKAERLESLTVIHAVGRQRP
jgi:hypothetical protein